MEDASMSLGAVLTSFVTLVLLVSVATKEWERSLRRKLQAIEVNEHKARQRHRRSRKCMASRLVLIKIH